MCTLDFRIDKCDANHGLMAGQEKRTRGLCENYIKRSGVPRKEE